jgi:hypothetical protein
LSPAAHVIILVFGIQTQLGSWVATSVTKGDGGEEGCSMSIVKATEAFCGRQHFRNCCNARPDPEYVTRIVRGPLDGIEGILASKENRHRVIITVNLIQQAAAVE